MALKTLLLRQRLSELKKRLETLRAKDADFASREAELEAAIAEAEAPEDQAALSAMVDEFDEQRGAHLEEVAALEEEIREAEQRMTELEAAQPAPSAASGQEARSAINNNPDQGRRDDHSMRVRSKAMQAMTHAERSAFVETPAVREFLDRFRAKFGAGETRGVTGGDLNIPVQLLDMIRANVSDYSKLIRRVHLVTVDGNARQTVMGTPPEAVWTEMCAALNEMNFTFNLVEVDGYKVGSYVAVCNSSLKDSIGLADAIIVGTQQALGIALDKAILFGKGTKMPLGIATRIAQTSEPSDYPAEARPWEDLHTSHVITIPSSATGVAFFQAFLSASAAAKGSYSRGVKFWAMNEVTYSKIMGEALSINAAGAIVSGVGATMPVVGGDIVVFSDKIVPDNTVIGGYGDLYLLAEREGAVIDSSEHARFIQDQTVFRGVARYDGLPVIAEGFVVIGIGQAPTTSMDFAPDRANSAPVLTGLTIGSLALSPSFSSAVNTYTAATTSATNVITASTGYEGDTVEVEVNGVAVENGKAATWSSGANTVTVRVTNASGTTVYTVTVTKS